MTLFKTYWPTVLVVALFIGALVFVLHRGPPDRDLYLWDLKAEEIASIEVKREGSPLRFTATDGHWTGIEAGHSFPIDDKKFAWRVEMLLHPRADSRLDLEQNQAVENDRYGLNPSVEEIVITETNGGQLHLLVGSRTPLQRNYYARLPKQSVILLMPVSILAPLLELKKEDVTVTQPTQSLEGIPEAGSPAHAQSPQQ